MAEVLGATASIIALVETTGRTVSYCYRLQQAWKSAPADITYVIDEIDAFRAVVDKLYHQVKASERDGYELPGLAPLDLRGEESLIVRSISVVGSIRDLLPEVSEGAEMGKRQKLSWMKDKSDVNKRLEKLRQVRDQIQFALDAESLTMQRGIQKDVRVLVVSKEDEGLLNWLAAPSCSGNLAAAMEKKQEGTGNWLLDSKDFKEWMQKPSLLWLYGIPGCGKSILSSTVIYHLQQFVEPSSSIVLYFYFDFQDESKRKVEHMLRALIAQVLVNGGSARSVIRARLDKFRDDDSSLNKHNMMEMLQGALASFGSIYFVADGLDESHDLTDRSHLMTCITSLKSRIDTLHLLLLSRPEEDLEEWREKHADLSISLEGQAIQDDIALYVDEFIISDPRMSKWPKPVREYVEKTLIGKSQGMFRWVFCHLDSLKSSESFARVKWHLERLPTTLHETYDQILSNLDPAFGDDARRILLCLAFAQRSLTVSELLCIFAIDPQAKKKFDKDALPFDRGAIQRICRSLITIVPGPTKIDGSPNLDEVVRLAHFSVEEYLLSEETRNGPLSKYSTNQKDAHRELAEICMATLLHFNNRASFGKESLEEFPFLLYAANHAIAHARVVNEVESPLMDDLIFTLFHESEAAYINWHRVCHPLWIARGTQFGEYTQQKISRQELFDQHRMIHPLAYCAIWNLWRVAERLINAGNPVNQWFKGNNSAICASVMYKHYEMLQVLLKHHADIEIRDWVGLTPLLKAVVHRDLKMVRYLLDKGANIEGASDVQGTPLQFAASLGEVDIIAELLDRGADINRAFRHEKGSSIGIVFAVQDATRYGQLEALKLLVSRGARLDVFAPNKNKTVHLGVDGFEHVVASPALNAYKLKIERPKGENYPSILAAAAASGNMDVVEYLVNKLGEAGKLAIVDAMGLSPASPDNLDERLVSWNNLCEGDREEYIKELMDRAVYYLQRTIIESAKQGSIDNIQRHLDQNADIERKDSLFHRTPLAWAVVNGHYDAVRLLLDSNADPNCWDRDMERPLHLAVKRARPDIGKLLIERGADPSIRCHRKLTPLMLAKMRGRDRFVKYLSNLENASPT